MNSKKTSKGVYLEAAELIAEDAVRFSCNAIDYDEARLLYYDLFSPDIAEDDEDSVSQHHASGWMDEEEGGNGKEQRLIALLLAAEIFADEEF